MTWIIDLQTVPNNYKLKDVAQMLNNKEYDKLAALGIEFKPVPHNEFVSITCACHGVNNAEDCTC